MTEPQPTEAEKAMRWERMSGERLSDADRKHVMDGGKFVPPHLRPKVEHQTTEPRQEDVETLLYLAEKANRRWAEIADNQRRLLVALREALPCVASAEWCERTVLLMKQAEECLGQ